MNSGVSVGTKIWMYVVAGFIDVLQILIATIPFVGFIFELVLGPVINLIALIIFWLWFKNNGISIFAGKAFVATMVVMLIETVPVLNIVAPGFIGLVHMALRESRKALNSGV